MRQRPIWLGFPRQDYDDTLDYLRTVNVQIAPEGDGAIFKAQMESSRTVNVKVSTQQMGLLTNLVKSTAATLVAQQIHKLDCGSEYLWGLIHSAPTPAALDLYRHPATGDLIFVYQFTDQAPTALRVATDQYMHRAAHIGNLVRALTN